MDLNISIDTEDASTFYTWGQSKPQIYHPRYPFIVVFLPSFIETSQLNFNNNFNNNLTSNNNFNNNLALNSLTLNNNFNNNLTLKNLTLITTLIITLITASL